MAIGRFTKNLQFEKAPELSFEEAMFVPMQRKAEKDKIMDSLYAIDSDVLATEQDKTGILNDYSNQFNSKIEDISNSLLGSGSDLSDLRRKTLAVKKDVEQSKNSGVYFQANKFYTDLQEAKKNFFSQENGQDRELLNKKWNEKVDEWKAKGALGAFDSTTGELRDWNGQWAVPPKDQDHIKHMLEVARTAGIQTSDISPARIQTTKGPNGAVVFSLVGDTTKLSNSKNLQNFVDLMNAEYSTGASVYARDWDFKGLTMDDLAKQLKAVANLADVTKIEGGPRQIVGSSFDKSKSEGEGDNADLPTTNDVVSGVILTTPQNAELTASKVINAQNDYETIKKTSQDTYYKIVDGKEVPVSKENREEATHAKIALGGVGKKGDLTRTEYEITKEKNQSWDDALDPYYTKEVGVKRIKQYDNVLDYMEPTIIKEMIDLGMENPTKSEIDNFKNGIKADPAAYQGYIAAFIEDHNTNYGSQGILMYNTTGIGKETNDLVDAIDREETAKLKTTDAEGNEVYSKSTKLYPLTDGYDDPINIGDIMDDVDGAEFNIVGRVAPENISALSSGYVVKEKVSGKLYTIPFIEGEVPNPSDLARHSLTREIANPKNLKGDYTLQNPNGGSVNFKYNKTSAGISVTPTMTDAAGNEKVLDSFTVARPSDVIVTFGTMKAKAENQKVNNASVRVKDTIKGMESGNDYNSLYNTSYGSVEDFYSTAGQEYAGKDISTLTVNEVLDLQDKFVDYQNSKGAKGNGSSAIGNYQFIKPTLKRLLERGDISYNQVFTDELQETLADMLFDDAGVFDYVAGTSSKSVDEIIYNLSKIWAAIPMGPMGVNEGIGDNPDNSYYKGTGNNKALRTYEDFKAVIENSKK